MVSLSYSAPAPSSNDPIFVRTHFLGRVASDASGLDYQHELLKRRSSRHSELNRWDANWLAPVTHVMDYDSDETSDTDDDVLNAVTRKAAPAHHPRSRSSTLPLTVTSAVPVEMVRARSMTAPDTSSSSFETRTLRQNRSIVGSESRLMPARPLTIDTAQPLRMPSLNVSTISAEPSLTIQVPSPVAAVGPSPKTCSPPVVRIECSESDGSCHGDAGDQDPEAQLAAGIIRLREQRRTSSSSSSKSQRRVGSKRRALTQSPRSPPKQQPKALDDADSDDAQSLVIRKHGGNFVLRWAEKVLDFGSSALEKLVLPDTDESYNDASFDTQQSPIQPRRRSSTTPKQLNAEAGELLRRRRERISSLLPSDSVIEPDSTRRVTLTRSWSVPKLLSLPLFNPSASLRALSSSTSSTPSTPMSAPAHLHNDFGFTSISAKPSKYQEISSFDDVGASFSRQSASLYTHSSSVSEVVSNPGHVSPLWKQ